ncbi:MAG: 30S ribosome-binding factor RbfA [Chloroflexota bacterium]
MVSKGRANKIAQRIQEELSNLLLFDVSDPRIEGVYVTTIRVDREMAYANVFVSALEGSERKEEILSGLKHATGFLRSQLAQKTNLRFFPRLRFNWDPSPEHVERIDTLLESLNITDEGDDPQDG